MAQNKKVKKEVKEIIVEAKVVKSTVFKPGKIVVKGKGVHKIIPAVLFSESETETLLEIIDKVERATSENFVYNS